MRWKIFPLLAAVFSLFAFLPATARTNDAATPPGAPETLKEIRIMSSVIVHDSDVTLLQICDSSTLSEKWKSIMGAQDIGDAPPVGSEKFVEPAQLRAFLITLLNSHGVNPASVKLDIPSKVVVTRASTRLTQQWVESVFKKYILENTPWKTSDINIENIRLSGIPEIPAGTLSYTVRPVTSAQRLIGNVSLSVDLYVDGQMARTIDILGQVEVYQNVYFASRPLKRNDIISTADLEVRRMDITDSVDRYATHSEQVQNHRVLYNVGVHQPLTLSVLDKPLVIKNGDPVRIVFQAPGLMVSAKGRANGDGAIGDTLAVTNTSSTKTIYCKVLDSQTVKAVQ
ncbi:MAG: flagellar basal body P-ring formation chaperone FlgA [Syntrophobacteraceae bacterium]